MTLTTNDIIISPPPTSGKISFPVVFGNDHSVELEIGTGKGGFLLEQATANPERNYLGIEWANKFFLYAADRFARRGLTNVRMMRTDAKTFVLNQLAESSLSAIHIYHPDPWPKHRHHKRRLIDAAFLHAAADALLDGGWLKVQTDHAEYFEVIRSCLSDNDVFEKVLEVEDRQAENSAIIATNFQIKYEREGRRFYRVECARRNR